MIHKTAIIDPKAKVASSAEIGPYTVIGSNVEIGETIPERFYKAIAEILAFVYRLRRR